VATLYEVSGDKTDTARITRATTHLQEAHTWASTRMESRRRDFSRRYAQYRGNMNVFGKDPVQSQLRSQLWVPKSAALVETAECRRPPGTAASGSDRLAHPPVGLRPAFALGFRWSPRGT